MERINGREIGSGLQAQALDSNEEFIIKPKNPENRNIPLFDKEFDRWLDERPDIMTVIQRRPENYKIILAAARMLYFESLKRSR